MVLVIPKPKQYLSAHENLPLMWHLHQNSSNFTVFFNLLAKAIHPQPLIVDLNAKSFL
jgi:hypothetical protein